MMIMMNDYYKPYRLETDTIKLAVDILSITDIDPNGSTSNWDINSFEKLTPFLLGKYIKESEDVEGYYTW